MKLLAYVAAPYEDAAFIRIVHERLQQHDIQPTSRWAESARGADDFAAMTPAALRSAAADNDADLRGSDAVLVIARSGAGGEMFAEARLGLEWGKPVVWTGRLTLSAFRSGVVRAVDLDDAISVLLSMQRALAEGYRGHLLAHLARSAA